MFFSACKWAKFITIIHDEVIYSIPEDKIKETRVIADKVLEDLNEILSWSVKVRLGFKTGSNFYTAK
jgi:DNA polymerase I-like protein with 3'-5' exonuclease and polymerase domains